VTLSLHVPILPSWKIFNIKGKTANILGSVNHMWSVLFTSSTEEQKQP
jgi:hypothetical protein